MWNLEGVRIAGEAHQLPPMIPVEQHFAAEVVDDLDDAIRTQIAAHAATQSVDGKRLAVGVGSRGVARIDEITRIVVDELLRQGAKPFVIPAMGSHGGGTSEGQRDVLASYGITEDSVGVPIVASMETVELARLPDGTPVHFDAEAAAADGVVVINRVKPHTDFKGGHESGLAKMLAIGFGKHRGATTLHPHGFEHFPTLIPDVASAMMRHVNVEFGLAVVENAYERVGRVEVVEAANLLQREAELLELAKVAMPRFLVDEIDVLVVDELGKDISGAGMDPNVTGRAPVPVPGMGGPQVQRIVVLDLTERTHGNATGIGIADVTTVRCAEQIDLGPSYTNALASGVPESVRLPMVLHTDRDAISGAVHMCRRIDPDRPRIARIRNTLSLARIELSEPYAEQIADHADLRPLGPAQPWEFDETGHLPR